MQRRNKNSISTEYMWICQAKDGYISRHLGIIIVANGLTWASRRADPVPSEDLNLVRNCLRCFPPQTVSRVLFPGIREQNTDYSTPRDQSKLFFRHKRAPQNEAVGNITRVRIAGSRRCQGNVIGDIPR